MQAFNPRTREGEVEGPSVMLVWATGDPVSKIQSSACPHTLMKGKGVSGRHVGKIMIQVKDGETERYT